jgi:Cu-processing system permease protein
MIARIDAPLSPAALAWTIARHQSRDVLRKRWVVAYAVGLAIVGDLLLRLAGGGPSALVSLLNVSLVLIPLIAMILGSASLYGAREFTELLLAQPIPRRSLFVGLYLGLSIPLATATAVALLLPFVIERALDPAIAPVLALLVAVSVMLVCVFTALAFLITVRVADRARGLGLALSVWLAMALVYDGVVLVVATALRDWPIERGMLVAMVLNPIDLARTLLLLKLDVAAMTGYTGAIFRAVFDTMAGTMVALGALSLWVLIPWWLAARAFDRRDY